MFLSSVLKHCTLGMLTNVQMWNLNVCRNFYSSRFFFLIKLSSHVLKQLISKNYQQRKDSIFDGKLSTDTCQVLSLLFCFYVQGTLFTNSLQYSARY